MRCRRERVAGATYFFTVNSADRRIPLLVNHIGILREVMRKVMIHHPFHINAMVVLPEHLHAIWTLPEGDNDFSTRWMLIKSGFSRYLQKNEPCNTHQPAKVGRDIWQRRFREHLIRDSTDLEKHIAYIHYNPVKHGLVRHPSDWLYSSVHRYISEGLIPAGWTTDGGMLGEYGE